MTEDEAARRERIARDQPPFARHIGVRVVSVAPDEIVAEMDVTPPMGNRNGVLHGGALMAFADNLGGTAAVTSLGDGQSTTTVESKTNFFRAVRIGEVVRGICTPLHKGNRTMVWQTRILRPDGKLAAIVTQTQMILRDRGGDE